MAKRSHDAPHRSTTAFAAAIALTVLVLAPVPGQAADDPCNDPSTYTPTWAVQGEGATSPLEGQTVDEVRGVVTMDAQRDTGGPSPPEGFLVEAHEPDCDPATSDGLFVYTGSVPVDVEPGQLVALEGGNVVEFDAWGTWPNTLTELSCRDGCTVTTLDANHTVPEPTAYAAPTDPDAAQAYKEAREAMQVRVDQAHAAGPTNTYEELVLAPTGDPFRPLATNGPHGDLVRLDGNALTACSSPGLEAARTLDAFGGDGQTIRGPLTVGYGGYRVLQADDAGCPTPETGSAPYAPANDPIPEAEGLTVATLNAYNFFDAVDDPLKEEPVATGDAYERSIEKLAQTVCSPDVLDEPAVLALQEVENRRVLTDLAAEALDKCTTSYVPLTHEAPDDRSIQQGLLVDPARATPIAVQPRQGCSETDRGVDYERGPATRHCQGSDTYYLHNRPPLEVALATDDGPVRVLVTHFKSQLPSLYCWSENCENWRTDQAEHVAQIVNQAPVPALVVGDLNAQPGSPSLSTLTDEADMANLWSQAGQAPEPTARYSYVHEGISQAIDHVLVGPAIDPGQATLTPRHANADWPPTYEQDPGTYLGASDHDPLLAHVQLG
jgi:hypothetical protein